MANECKGSRPLPWLLLARPTRRPSKNVGLLRSSLHDVRRELNPECFGDRLVENQFLDGDFLERDVAGLFAAQGLGISASGLFAEIAGPAAAIATFAVIGVLAAIPAGIAWRQAARPSRTREKGGVIMTRGKPIEWH